jgi:type I restriction enzyme M protein
MKSKIRGKPTKISSPFDTTAHKTERAAVAVLMHWMREIIENKGLDLGLPDVDTSGPDGKFPDTVIYESRRSKKVLCVIEAKPPYYDVFDEKELKEPARSKATKRKATYFVTTNFKKLIWFNLKMANAARPEEEQVIQKYSFSDVEDLDSIEETAYKNNIKRGLEQFLTQLYLVYTKKEAEPKQAIDEFLVFRLREKIRVLSGYYKEVIYDQCNKDPKFAKKLREWFREQVWTFAWQPQDFDKAARQTAYLLVNKILFYNVLQAIRPSDLEPLEIPKSLFKGESLQAELQKYFGQVLKIDYETIYTTDFIDSIAFPDAKEIVEEIKELISVLRRYDFSTLGYDIIGRIFEQLIPQQERHMLGQYFTNADVVDLILKFCLNHEDDKLLDPACGAGTFLVRAYQHKKLMNQYKGHEEILKTLWGDDIAKFPATLSIINLAINDLEVSHNYPNILCEDFFGLLVDSEGFKADEWRKSRAKTLNKDERKVTYPRWFDAVVGNPPYTRQEEIAEISPDSLDYKKDLIKAALYNSSGKIKLADIGKRAGVYAYFFVHGIKFLKDKGYFGFIVSNAWLDVDYGKGLQEFFLQNYKIITIIESKVERWFEEADINTCIIILQKCKDKKERDENLVRFVYLKKPLRHFVPPAKDMWEKQIERLKAIDNLKRTILGHNEIYENEDLRIFPKQQGELWEEGFDTEKQRYDGAKWGKYLRVKIPDIYFKILKKGENVLTNLNNVADVKPGCYTGVNDFFYLERRPEYKDRVEKEFLISLIRSTKDVRKISINVSKVDKCVFSCSLSKQELKRDRKKNALEYITWGESQVTRKRQKVEAGVPWSTVETVKKRKPGWWSIPKKDTYPAQIFMIYVINERFIVPYSDQPIASDRCFHRVFPNKDCDHDLLAAVLNSTMTIFSIETYGRSNLGLGALKFESMDAKKIPIVDPRGIKSNTIKKVKEAFNKLKERDLGSIFEELGTLSPDNLSLDKIKPDRRELDKIIMGEMLGLTDDEQLEVYRAVVDLVKSRLEKAKSVGDKKKTKEGIDIDAFVETVLKNIGTPTFGEFYKEKVLTQKRSRTKKLPEGSGKIKIEQLLQGWRLYSGKKYVECESEAEARYLKAFVGTGIDKVKVPSEAIVLQILPELENIRAKIDSVVDSYLESIISEKTRLALQHHIWAKLLE